MDTESEEIARLNVAAKALTAEKLFHNRRGAFLLINALQPVVLISCADGKYEPWFGAVVVLCAIFVTASFWTTWRFKFLAVALWWSAIALGCVVMGRPKMFDDLFTFACFVAVASSGYWMQAGPYAKANGPGWERERVAVEGWWERLNSPGENDEIVQFTAKSIGYGAMSYRLMRLGPYWAIFSSYRRFTRRVGNLSVRALSEVSFARLPSGESEVRIGNRTMRTTDLSPSALEVLRG